MARLLVVITAVALCTALPLVEAFSSGKTPQVVKAEDETGSGSATDELWESIRQIIREGSEELGIPVLDPLQIKSIETTIEEDRTYEVKGSLKNAAFTGLGDFQGKLSSSYVSGTIGRLQISVTVSLPVLDGEGGYAFNSLLGEVVNLYGDGNFKLKISELEVTVVATISPRLTTSRLSSLTTTINAVDFEFELDGLLEGGLVDGIFNLAVNEVAKVIFREQKSVLEQFLAELLYDPIENVVKQYGFLDLVCMFTGLLCL